MIWVQILGKFPRPSWLPAWGHCSTLLFYLIKSDNTGQALTGPAVFRKPKSQQQLSEFLTQFSPQGDLKVKAEVPTVAYGLEDAARSAPCYPSALSLPLLPLIHSIWASAISGTCQAHPTLGPLCRPIVLSLPQVPGT